MGAGGHHQWQTHAEFAALTWPGACGLHAALVHAYQLLDQRQADTQTASGHIQRLVNLPEHVKDMRQPLNCNANAHIGDGQHCVVALALGF